MIVCDICGKELKSFEFTIVLTKHFCTQCFSEAKKSFEELISKLQLSKTTGGVK